GRSLRSSPRAGEPRTWRREAADAYASEAAGASHVCGIQTRPELAPERAKEVVRAKFAECRIRLPEALGAGDRPTELAARARARSPEQGPPHGGRRRHHGGKGAAKGTRRIRRGSARRAALGSVSTEPGSAGAHPQSRTAREVSPPRHPHRERPLPS